MKKTDRAEKHRPADRQPEARQTAAARQSAVDNPDRGAPPFRYFTLSAGQRYTYSAVIMLATGAVQMLTIAQPFFSLAVSLALIIPLFLLASGSYTNKPDDQGKENWRTVTMTEIDTVAARIKTLKTAPVPFLFTSAYAALFTVLCLGGVIFCLITGNFLFACVCLDIFFIASPFVWNARIKKWHPAQLEKRLAEYKQLLSYSYPKDIRVVPSLRFDETAAGEKLPEDFRMMIVPDKKPTNLLGAQFQLAYNDGPNGKVPYLYAVILTKEAGKAGMSDTLTKLASFRADGFVTEADPGTPTTGDNAAKTDDAAPVPVPAPAPAQSTHDAPGGEKPERYGSLVIRQDTNARSDGYHTKPADIDRLIREVIRAFRCV